MSPHALHLDKRFWLWLGGIIAAFVALWMLADGIYPDDWVDFYKPAADDWRNRNDYGVYNPPWLILILKPLLWLGWQAGYAVMGAVTLGGVAWGVYRLSEDHKAFRVTLSLFNLPMLFAIMLGQIDGIALLGVMLATFAAQTNWRTTSGGMLLALIKPQMTLGAVIISGWRSPYKRHILTFGLVCLMISVVIWGIWFTQTDDIDLGVSWNEAFPLFPYGFVIGVPLVAWGMWQKEESYGLLAMPFLVPYLGPHSFLGITIFGIMRLPFRWSWLAWLLPAIWILVDL